MSDQQGGFGTFVCASCLEDEALRVWGDLRGEMRRCDYCGETPKTLSVVSLDSVIEFIGNAIGEEWCDPVHVAPHCSADGGYLVRCISNHELFETIGFEVSNQRLMADLLDAFGGHDWCEVNWQLSSPSERWGNAWEKFERVIKHERRYTFWYSDDDGDSPAHPDHLPPSQMLSELQAVINIQKMVKELVVGTLMWRVRCHDGDKTLVDAGEFTPPPIQSATQPNRMSPAGVPMFYGAADFQTAVSEVFDPNDSGKGKSVSGAQFRSLLPLNVLDLTAIPAMPSYFAPDGPFNRHIIRFLRKFTKALAQPIKRDGQPHIEYVPTQVFTEFVRHVMKGPQGVPIHGIKYPSSRNGLDCYVIFADKEACLPSSGYRRCPQILQFVDGSIIAEPVP